MNCKRCGASCKYSENPINGRYILIDNNSERPHDDVCTKKRVYVKTFAQQRAEYNPYTSDQLLHFKLISGPDGSKGRMELEARREEAKPSQIMIDAYRNEMKAKGIDIDAPVENPKPQPRIDDKKRYNSDNNNVNSPTDSL